MLEALADLLRIGGRRLFARQQQRRREHRLVQLRQQRVRHGVRGNAHADRLAPRMRQPARHLARGAQDERVAAWRGALEQAKARVVDDRIGGDLRQVPAHQRQVVARIHAPHPAQALHRARIVEAAAQRVAGIRRIGDQPAVAHDLRGAAHQPRLRMRRMYREVLRH